MPEEFTDENGVFHRADGTLWVSDGGKRDNWETFEDCHTQIFPTSDSPKVGVVVPLIIIFAVVATAIVLYLVLR